MTRPLQTSKPWLASANGHPRVEDSTCDAVEIVLATERKSCLHTVVTSSTGKQSMVLARGARTCPSKYGERVETLGGVKAQLFTRE